MQNILFIASIKPAFIGTMELAGAALKETIYVILILIFISVILKIIHRKIKNYSQRKNDLKSFINSNY